jgi:sulfatase modifying factor 1
MQDEAAFLQAMQENPEDTALRLVFADWLEERGDPRGELVRLLHTLTQAVKVRGRKKLEDRLQALLASGVQPVGPFWTNSIGMKFAWIPAGTFLMGSPVNEEKRGRGDIELQHRVTLSMGFYLAVHPVTQASWREVMGTSPSQSQGDDLPVEQVSWWDCQEFLENLSEKDSHAYRLPTEAEWEYACRAGTTTPFFFGETISTDRANYNGKRPYGKAKKGLDRDKTTPVGSFPPNAWGLYDMHGNVWEWCEDWYPYDEKYPQGHAINPQGPEDGDGHVLRGGCFGSHAADLRSATRHGGFMPTDRFNTIGFRPAKTFSP